MRFSLSSILHGEQGALSLSTSLAQILRDPGAQEYAANQAREEARHVAGFSKYVQKRWGKPLACGTTLANLMNDIVLAPEVYKKLVGMQMLIEGLAMGAFATFHSKTNDPTLRRLIQLVMSDEAFHHRFGKIWADRTVPQLTEEEHEKVEDWAAKCFQTLLFNLVNAEQKQAIYPRFGLEWQWVRSAVLEAFTDNDRRHVMRQSTNIFRVLIKTLLQGRDHHRTHQVRVRRVGGHGGAARRERRGGGERHRGRHRARAARHQRGEEQADQQGVEAGGLMRVAILGAGASGICLGVKLREAGLDGLHDLREVRGRRRHLARQPLPRRVLRRALALLQLLLRAEGRLVAEVRAAGGDPGLLPPRRREVRAPPAHPLRHGDRERALRRGGRRLAPPHRGGRGASRRRCSPPASGS